VRFPFGEHQLAGPAGWSEVAVAAARTGRLADAA
jgi:hypothetical protein